MPISAAWDPDARLWTLSVGPRFTLGEVIELVRDNDWKGARSFLWDLRTLQEGPDATVEIQEAADFSARTEELWRGGRVGVVVERDFDYGIARMFGAFAEQLDVEYQIFRDMDEALAWMRSD